MKILGSPFFSLMFILIFIFFLYRYWKFLIPLPKYYRLSLFVLRSLSIVFLTLLLLNPWMDWTSNDTSPQNISVIFDVSESVIVHLDENELEYPKI